MDQQQSRTIISSVVEAFNTRSCEIGYGPTSSCSLPVRPEDLSERPVMGGVSPQPVDDCRALAMYIIAQHILVKDHFAGRDRLMSVTAVGNTFHRSERLTSRSIAKGCGMLDQECFSRIYADALQMIEAHGVDLWRPPHRTLCK